MAHGLSGTRRDRLEPFAERFAAGGIAALVFDYRGFGDSTGEPDLFDPARQLDDWRAAIAFARSLPRVDAGRVATFGSSLGGGNALAAAAEDPRVAAAISQVPFLDRDSVHPCGGPAAGWRHVVAIGEDSRWRNRISAGWLRGPPYGPIRHAATLHCRWLVCGAGSD
jgi:predicted acyl esterase